MKKRNLGRIAAIGLAGLTSIPVVAMTASASVTVSPAQGGANNLPQLSGTAYRATWSTNESVTTYDYSLNTDGKFVCTPSIPTNNPYVTFGDSITIKGSSFVASDDVYYGYLDKTPGTLRRLEDAIKRSEEEDRKAKTDNDALMNEYNSYQTALTNATNQHDSSATKKGQASFTTHDKKSITLVIDNGTVSYTYGSNKAYVYTPITTTDITASLTVTDYTVSKTTATNITMKQLHDAFGGNQVYMDDMGIIREDSSDFGSDSSNIKQYTLNTTGGSNNNNSGNTGNYGQYDIPSLYRYASNTSYYSYDTDTWYPNSSSFREAVGYYPNSSYNGYWTSKTPAYKYSSSRRWFDPTDGNYYTASGGSGYTVLVSANYETDNTENYVYRSSTTGLYYLTWTAANNATNSYGTVEAIRSIPTYATFFSMTTGQFYSTYAAAYSASGNNSSRVIALNGASASNTGLDYLDPFYYYYMNGGTGLNRPTTDTSSVTIGNRKGWTNVAAYARSAKSGASYNVSMNGETVIPSTVLSAIKGKNVTMNFTLKNGAVYSINGTDVSSAKDLDIDTAYNTKNIPSKLVSKAKSKYDGVSTSQLSIDGGSFGASAEMTVKFSTKRAGCTARLYRYNADRNSLSLVSKSSVGSNGKCTFDDVTKGGDYVVVLS